MNSRRTITIVGGGLAGLTLGIGLRQGNVPVVIWEAGAYPRHRVCGEFVSGRGLETLQRLGLMDALMRRGARPAHTATFYYSGGRRAARDLPKPAVCLSRFALDALLADVFRGLGGELRWGERWSGTFCREGVVCATGRRAQTRKGDWHWYGLKAHVKNIPLAADLEMHFGRNGYVGLCQLSDGKVNVCGLFRRKNRDSPLPQDLATRFSADGSTTLTERLGRAEWDQGSLCAIGGLLFHRDISQSAGVCRLGDAFVMIAPVTGNGMSMAFESAELALEPLRRYAQGCLGWDAACGWVRRSCCATFGRRLLWASGLHAGIFQSTLSCSLFPWLDLTGFLWRRLFHLTR